jgi:trans-aconitate methyltransferase
MVDAAELRLTRRYDPLATGYDSHFARPVDHWEDEWMMELLAPIVNDRDVLDLGCGTGWVLDHLFPARYIGVDSSPDMLKVLRTKHGSSIDMRCLSVGTRGWADELPQADAIVATWAADYFPNLADVLADLHALTKPGGVIALHGYQERGRHRRHCIDREAVAGDWSPAAVTSAAIAAELPSPWTAYGTGWLPDSLARVRSLWRATLTMPWRYHYGALHIWKV